jgi:dihydropteroate synthase
MSIINLSPDSFYQPESLQIQGEQSKLIDIAGGMIEAGADILDLGAASSRPGAEQIPEELELERILPAIESLRQTFPEAVISVDTYRANVVDQVCRYGADIINDISAGNLDSEMLAAVARNSKPYILMHMQGNPQSMQDNPQYDEVVADVLGFFQAKLQELQKLGIWDVALDPGFGFGKLIEQNYQLLGQLDVLDQLGFPILVGLSRKSMIYKYLEIDAEKALNGTTVLHTIALLSGAKILRVHDPLEARQCIDLVEFYKEQKP